MVWKIGWVINMVSLLPHQVDVLEQTKDRTKVAYYLDMGLGKTFVGSEKMVSLHTKVNLVICQKSKVDDWKEHFRIYYPMTVNVIDATKEKIDFIFKSIEANVSPTVIIINYELAFRRLELANLRDFTLMLDESSMIQNETAKRSKFVLKRLCPKNVILLSGTPTSGKYERLWSQMRLLGWNISKRTYYAHYVDIEITPEGYPIIRGYKNVDRLKHKMREYGCVFMKSDEVLDLPEQNFIDVKVPETKEYKKFKKTSIVTVEDDELVGDTTLTKMLYSRMLCGHYNKVKVSMFEDLLESTNDRLIVFYNFNAELEILKEICQKHERPTSEVNGAKHDLSNYHSCDNSVTLVQYQAGSMGINLQLSNKIIYFTPTLSSELFEQSKKRIHRIGQEHPCFYYQLKCGIEERIYKTLAMRRDYTDALFEQDFVD